MPTFTLYSYWRSSSSYRVRIVLALKGLSYHYKAVHLLEGGGQQHQPEYLAINPMAQVPSLLIEEDGKTWAIRQSLVICDYLDRRYKEPLLIPEDAKERAQVLSLCEIVNSSIQPLANLSLLQKLGARESDFNQEKKSLWVKDIIAEGFKALELELKRSKGPFAIGQTPSLADAFIVPQVYNARRYGLDLSPFPRIQELEASALELQAFQKAAPEEQPDAPEKQA